MQNMQNQYRGYEIHAFAHPLGDGTYHSNVELAANDDPSRRYAFHAIEYFADMTSAVTHGEQYGAWWIDNRG
ncbi:hypothetical protein SAMN05216551_101294 [Chitinasiproducens palmae]|uniref:Uncharacterized protein n=2 Tax=Chitinasiproducens palmae TaxID=1770053 RepID=A0A1H2PJ53_9BURK|nr:hypothetical protein SAMN05216551_101294 [Chitinasiproducens palmae]